MLFMDTEGLRGAEKQFARFWSRAHAVDSLMDGWQLALWYRQQPAWASSQVRRNRSDTIAAIAWPGDGRRRNWKLLSVDVFVQNPAFLVGAVSVVLARKRLPPDVFRLLEERLDYRRELPGQVNGWWYEAVEKVPSTRPDWRHTGALYSPPQGIGTGRECLVLVEIDDWWGVLSERALYTYTFGSHLADGETVAFLCDHSELGGVELSLARRINHGIVHTDFGVAAAERARDDAKTVVLDIVQVHEI